MKSELLAWRDSYEAEEKRLGIYKDTMSRSNPTDATRNPAVRWFEWAGGTDGGFVRYYDKATEKQVSLGDAEKGGKFLFILLDELATVKGWHDASESSIYANEVRDTRQDILVVKAFKGGELASGLYANIKDRIVAVGGYFVSSCYIAFKDDEGKLQIGNIRFKGASLGAWMDFKKECPSKKDASGKNVKAFYVDAVKIEGFEQQKKGGTTFRIPKFALAPLSAETNAQAVALDAELQAFLSDYLKRPRVEAAAAQAEAPQEQPKGGSKFDDMVDDDPSAPEHRADAEIPF